MKRRRSDDASLRYGLSEGVEVVETKAAGRAVRAINAFKKGDIICTTDSFATASSIEGSSFECCRNCGYSIANESNDTQTTTHGCCDVCGYARLLHSEVGEADILKCWPIISAAANEEDPEEDIPAQALLAYRILMHSSYYVSQLESTADPYDLIGDASDCDDVRMAMADNLVAVAEYNVANGHPAGSALSSSLTLENTRRVLGIIHRNAFKVRHGVITLFPGAAMFNHACGPNAVMTVEYVTRSGVDGANTVVGHPSRCLRATVRCVADISPGEEISISYVPLGLHPRDQRQQAIAIRHDFVCGCEFCSSGLGEDLLLEQGVTNIGGMSLSIEPVAEMIEEAEELLESLTIEEDPDVEDILFLLHQSENSIANLQLGPLHYLTMKRLALLAEVSQLQSNFEDVWKHTSDWLAALCSEKGQNVACLCDPHYRCRMLVLNAEALGKNLRAEKEVEDRKCEMASTYERSCSVTATKINQELVGKATDTFEKAIEWAQSIYGEDYALVVNLRRQLSEIQQIFMSGSPPS